MTFDASRGEPLENPMSVGIWGLGLPALIEETGAAFNNIKTAEAVIARDVRSTSSVVKSAISSEDYVNPIDTMVLASVLDGDVIPIAPPTMAIPTGPPAQVPIDPIGALTVISAGGGVGYGPIDMTGVPVLTGIGPAPGSITKRMLPWIIGAAASFGVQRALDTLIGSAGEALGLGALAQYFGFNADPKVAFYFRNTLMGLIGVESYNEIVTTADRAVGKHFRGKKRMVRPE